MTYFFSPTSPGPLSFSPEETHAAERRELTAAGDVPAHAGASATSSSYSEQALAPSPVAASSPAAATSFQQTSNRRRQHLPPFPAANNLTTGIVNNGFSFPQQTTLLSTSWNFEYSSFKIRAWRLHEQKQELDLVDPSLSSYNEDEACRLVGVALLCIQSSPIVRPTMSRVAAMLGGDIEISEVTLRPSYLTEWEFNDISSNFVSDEFSNSSDTRFTNSQVSMPSG